MDQLIDIQSRSNIVGCNSSGECWKWNGEEWTMLSDSPVLTECSVASDGALFGVTASDIYQWTGVAWSKIGVGVYHAAAVDSTHAYYLNSFGKLYFYDNGTGTELEVTTNISSLSYNAKDGSLFGIKSSDDSLVKWSGTAWGSSLGAATGLKQIAAKSATMVWAVGADDTLFYWNGLTWTQSDPGIAVSDISISNF